MHGIFYDHVHDEIVVPVALGGAVLTLPGGADGGDPPMRVLQGPNTGIVQPDTLYVDVAHDEMIVDSGDDSGARCSRGRRRVTWRRSAGSAGRRRTISNIYGMTVDASRNLIIVANRVESGGRESSDGILIFNRTDNGDVAPQASDRRARTPASSRSARSSPTRSAGRSSSRSRTTSRTTTRRTSRPSPWDPDKTGFIGVWSITDNGDVPPRGVIKGPATGLIVAGRRRDQPDEPRGLHDRQREQRAVHVQHAGVLLQSSTPVCRRQVGEIARAAATSISSFVRCRDDCVALVRGPRRRRAGRRGASLRPATILLLPRRGEGQASRPGVVPDAGTGAISYEGRALTSASTSASTARWTATSARVGNYKDYFSNCAGPRVPRRRGVRAQIFFGVAAYERAKGASMTIVYPRDAGAVERPRSWSRSTAAARRSRKGSLKPWNAELQSARRRLGRSRSRTSC